MKEGTLAPYLIGFASSIVLTLAAYFAVATHLFSNWGLVAAILALAVVQLVIQLLFFLHLGGSTANGRSQLAVFLSTISLVLIIVLGSLWIMNHLNYSMMASPSEMNQYIQNQQGGF